MKDPHHNRNKNPSAFKRGEGSSADSPNQTTRRTFLQAAGLGAAALAADGVTYGTQQVVDKDGKKVQGFEDIKKASAESSKGWKPVSDRKIRVGIVGYGFCKFGGAFGFQDPPNVDVVAVSDQIPDRRDGLAKACRCKKTYDSLEELVKDDQIEAVFCATDPPHHVQHCIEVLKHGKHVGVTVPTHGGSPEPADQLT